MSALPQRSTWTRADYLAFEREQTDIRHELIDGEIVAMSGASYEHNVIVANLMGLFYNQLADRPCQNHPSDMRVHVPATGLYTYPDVSVLCGEPELEDEHGDTLLNPSVIIKVLSPSTERYDRGKRFQHYRSITSLREYVLVSQEQYRIEHYIRQQDDTWILRDLVGLDAVLELASIDCKLSLNSIYRKITFGNQ
ncbi:MAG: Uma2 family endonuclease [Chloroflexota bacterium]